MRSALLAGILSCLAGCGAGAIEAAGRSAGSPEVRVADSVDLSAARAELRAGIAAGAAPGAVLLVGRGDDVLLEGADGLRSVLPVAHELAPDDLFDLASLTKPVATATAVMLLVEAEQVQLDRPVSTYLPQFTGGGKGEISVRHLLLHRAGLIADNPLADYGDGPDAAWSRICALRVRAPAGTAFEYSDVGYIVLGELVRAVDGRDLARFCAEEIFRPLGMDDTGFNPRAELRARCAPTELFEERWLCGVVHDPRARLLGGVAGHAGLFSTAADLARWCRMLLGEGRLGELRLMRPETVREMLRPSWLDDGTHARALGLDVDSTYSSARGDVYPRGRSFGHTGFTGTSLWIDPGSESYVILLTSRLHPDGAGGVVQLRRRVATAVAAALLGPAPRPPVLAGVDVLLREGCVRLAGQRVGLLTNRTGRTLAGLRTIDVLAGAPGVQLTCLLTPEHGLDSVLEGPVGDGVDKATGLPLHSLYGEARRPTPAMLEGLDAVVFDVQDVGVRYYTYATTLGYLMEACASAGVRVVVLDRPNPIGFLGPRGPRADVDRLSFISYRPIPVAHGMTIGELALFFNHHHGIGCKLEVVPLEGWRRAMAWQATGLTWVNPSPNMRSPSQAMLYPMSGLLEGSNLSVGRGTDQPFETLGAPWVDASLLAAALREARLPGLAFTPIEFTPRASVFAGQACEGIQIEVTDPAVLCPVESGLRLAWELNRLFGSAFDIAGVDARLLSRRTWQALMTTPLPAELGATWRAELAQFRAECEPFLIYD